MLTFLPPVAGNRAGSENPHNCSGLGRVGSHNTVIGYGAGIEVTTGAQNTAIGYTAGLHNTAIGNPNNCSG